MLLLLTLPLSLAAAQGEDGGFTTDGAAEAAGGIFEKIVALLAPIGALFGNAAGIRIGGSSGTGIVLLLIAVFFRKRLPFWLKLIACIIGIIMLAGGGANIMQVISGHFK